MIPLTVILTQIAAIPATDLGQIRPRFVPVLDSIVVEFAYECAMGSPTRSNYSDSPQAWCLELKPTPS